MSISLDEFLTKLNLDQYISNFEVNGVKNILIVNDDILQRVGVEKIGHRKRILTELDNIRVKIDANGENSIMDNELIDDEPPPLPPKLPPKQKVTSPDKPGLPFIDTLRIESGPDARSVSMSKPRPVKPPRKFNSVKKVNSLPIGITPSYGDYKLVLPQNENPPVPPRNDLGEELPPVTSNEISSADCIVDKIDNITSDSDNEPTRFTPLTSVQETPISPKRPAPEKPALDLSMLPKMSATEIAFEQPILATRPAPAVPVQEPLMSPTRHESRIPVQAQVTSPKRQAPPIPTQEHLSPTRPAPGKPIQEISPNVTAPTIPTQTTKAPDESPPEPPACRPIPPVRPSRLSVKRPTTIEPAPVKTTNTNIDMPLDENSETEIDIVHVAVTRRLSRATGHVGKRRFSENSSTSSPPIPQRPPVDNSEDDLSADDAEPRPLLEEDMDEIKHPEAAFTLSMVKDKEQFLSIVAGGERNKKEDRKSRFLSPGKSGVLLKRGGQRGTKGEQKRFIVFDGLQLCYYKDKGGDPKQIIPVTRMTDVLLEPNAKKPTFHLLTPNRRFTFIEPNGKQDELTIWVSILMEAILNKDESITCTIGGRMAGPDKEGWLSKQGHNLGQGFSNRYVAIKEDKFCYYHSFDDFREDLPINCLEMALVSLKEDLNKLRIVLLTNKERSYVFESEDLASHMSWKAAIEKSIQIGLGGSQFLQAIQENDSNKKCADCGDKNPIYASVNLLVAVCAECIGCHRFLGTQVSKSKSILMDEKVWTPSLVKIFQSLGNSKANSLWTSKLPSDDQIKPQQDRESRQEFITGKYKDKRYFQWSELFGFPDELGMALRANVVTEDVLETLKLIISGADVYYVPDDSDDKRTPYELAKDAGMDQQTELLMQYSGHLSLEEREMKKYPGGCNDGFVHLTADDLGKELESLPKIPDGSASNFEKTGVLLMRNTRNEAWKEKLFTLQGRKLKFMKGVKPEDSEVLDLTHIEELEFGKEDNVTFTFKISGRSYFLKGLVVEDADSWYTIIKNLQVMGIPIECQEVNDKGIPYLIEKCIAFIERNALLMQGIYRLNGSQLNIKKLILQFNQDAPKCRVNVDDFPDVHAVAGLLKQYLRELPEPLLTTKLYESFIANSYETQDEIEHNNKLYKYKELIQSLPEVNYLSLRDLILHLTQIIKVADRNKMKQQNIIVIFGPILLSCANTTEQSWLNAEYAVISDLLDYYRWLFEVSDVELKAMEAMIDVVKKTDDLETERPQQPMTIDSLQITVLIKNTEDQMKMTNQTMPSDVCLFAIQKYELSVDGNWALFEVSKDGVFERPVHAKEPVLQLAMSMGGRSDLVVKENYVAERIAPFQSANLGVNGLLHYAKEKDRWQKNYFAEVKTGNIKVYKKKGSSKEDDNIAIHEILLYIGVDLTKKLPDKCRYGFKLQTSEGVARYFCSDNEVEVNMFIAAILNIRYPTGLFTLLHADKKAEANSTHETTEVAAAPSPFWGRQAKSKSKAN